MIVIDYLSLLKKRLKSYKESYSFGTIDILVNYFFKKKFNGFLLMLDVKIQFLITILIFYIKIKIGME